MTRVEITDVVLRDGLQDEPVVVPTADKLRIAQALVSAGVPRLEVASFVNPARVPQMADAAEVVAGTLALPVPTTVLALNGRGIRRAVEAGARSVQIVASASDAHSTANAGRGREMAIDELEEAVRALRAEGRDFEVIGGISTAFVCPFEGEIDPARVAAIATRFESIGVDCLGLADTLGTASTAAVLATVGEVRASVPALELSLHLHNADGQAIDTVVAAVRLGIRRFDSALAGYGGCPFAPGAHGNIATETLVRRLHEEGIETGIDETWLSDAVALVRAAVAAAPTPVGAA